MRRPFIAGNWKMHLDREAISSFCAALKARGALGDVTVGVFPPFVYLSEVVQALSGSGVVVGGQTCRPEPKGAFTGEVAAAQVSDRRRACTIEP